MEKAVVFLIVIGGLIYITKAELGMTTTNSFLTTLGILLLLFIGDNFAQKIDDDRKRRKLNNDGKLIDLYKKWAGEEPADVIKLAGQGSNRQYFRIIGHDGDTVIGVIGTSRDEDHAFVYLAQHFQLRQLPVPQILAVSDDELCYLQTDLGGTSLFDAIKGGRDAGGRYNQKEKELLKKTIRELPNIQIRGARGLDWQNCYPQPEFDVDSVLFDLNYFKYCFLKPTDLDFTN